MVGGEPNAAPAAPLAGTSTVTAPGSARTRTGSSPIGSPSAYIVNGRSALTATSRARQTRHAGLVHVLPLNTFGRILVRNASLLTFSRTTTSSRPSSSSASGAARIPPP